jgi:ribosomal protein S18 acetylase RimI-like enzyme
VKTSSRLGETTPSEPSLPPQPDQNGSGADLYIIPMKSDHVGQAVVIYRESFEQSFLPSLGSSVLTLMFQSFLDDRRESALVCIDESTGKVVGFVCGSQDRSSYLRRAFFKYLAKAMPAVLIVSLRRPTVAIGLLRRSGFLKGAFADLQTHREGKLPTLPAASLMSIAVDRKYRGRGVGERLVRAHMDLMANQGVAGVKLGVYDSNHIARRLYERLGWTSAGTTVSRGGKTLHFYVCYFDR